MCPGSTLATRQENAEEGVEYQITATRSRTGKHRHGVLHKPGDGPAPDPSGARVVAKAACIREPSRHVQLNHVPLAIQRRFGMLEATKAVFLSGDTQEDGQDKVKLEGGREVLLYDLADQGIVLTLLPEEQDQPMPAPRAAERELVAA